MMSRIFSNLLNSRSREMSSTSNNKRGIAVDLVIYQSVQIMLMQTTNKDINEEDIKYSLLKIDAYKNINLVIALLF